MADSFKTFDISFLNVSSLKKDVFCFGAYLIHFQSEKPPEYFSAHTSHPLLRGGEFWDLIPFPKSQHFNVSTSL